MTNTDTAQREGCSQRGGFEWGCRGTSPGGEGVRPLPGVEGYQAHDPRALGDPCSLQAVHRGEPQHRGALASLAGVALPADDDRHRGVRLSQDRGVMVWSSRDRCNGPWLSVYWRVVVHNV